YRLEPRPSVSQGAWARTHEYVRHANLRGFDDSLLHYPDPTVRLAAMSTLEGYVEGGLDITALELTPREFSSGSPGLQEAGARLLARHLLRVGRPQEVGSLHESERIGIARGTLDAVRRGAAKEWEGLSCLPAVRPFLG